MGKQYEGIFRISYLIDPKGIIKKAYSMIKPITHAQQVLTDFKNLQKFS